MENKESKKSRLAEILGVEVGEKFRIQTNGGFMTFEVTTDGHFKTDPPQQVGSTYLLLDAINHPEKIIRKPRLTPEELAICKALGAKWVCRDKNDSFVTVLSRVKPMEIVPGTYTVPDRDGCVACISPVLLPSINPGDCVSVEELLREEKQ